MLRELNARRLLSIIREAGPISRPELARRTDLSNVTVTSISKSLIANGVLTEVGTGDQGLGRRPILLDVVPDAAAIFVADIRLDEITWRCLNVRGVTLAQGNTSMPHDADTLVRRLQTAAGPFLAHKRILEAVVAVPATVHNGRIRYYGKPGILDGILLATHLESVLQTANVHVVNDLNLAAIGEHREGAAKGWSRFAFIGIRSTGIGMGLILDGRLYHGANGRAGEIGNLRLGGDRIPFDARFTRISPEALDELAKVLAVTFAVLDLDGVVVSSEIEPGVNWLANLEAQLRDLVPFPITTVQSELGAEAVLTGAALVGLRDAWERLGGTALSSE